MQKMCRSSRRHWTDSWHNGCARYRDHDRRKSVPRIKIVDGGDHAVGDTLT
jgi:O-phosphoseryl-tRNA(Cys) synthetase